MNEPPSPFKPKRVFVLGPSPGRRSGWQRECDWTHSYAGAGTPQSARGPHLAPVPSARTYGLSSPLALVCCCFGRWEISSSRLSLDHLLNTQMLAESPAPLRSSSFSGAGKLLIAAPLLFQEQPPLPEELFPSILRFGVDAPPLPHPQAESGHNS